MDKIVKGAEIMTSHSDKLIAGIQYTACPGCAGTGKQGIVKRPCNLCRGKGKLPVSRNDGEGFAKKGVQY